MHQDASYEVLYEERQADFDYEHHGDDASQLVFVRLSLWITKGEALFVRETEIVIDGETVHKEIVATPAYEARFFRDKLIRDAVRWADRAFETHPTLVRAE